MKIKSILAQAAKCETQDDAENLLETMKKVFGKHKSLSRLGIFNEDCDMEGDKPFARFEFNREISDEYVTMIRPVIRDGHLTVVVQMNRMNDKLGMQSQDWETVDGMDDEFEQDDNQTIDSLCKRVVNQVIAYHRLLIEAVGVPEAIAKKTAKACW